MNINSKTRWGGALFAVCALGILGWGIEDSAAATAQTKKASGHWIRAKNSIRCVDARGKVKLRFKQTPTYYDFPGAGPKDFKSTVYALKHDGAGAAVFQYSRKKGRSQVSFYEGCSKINSQEYSQLETITDPGPIWVLNSKRILAALAEPDYGCDEVCNYRGAIVVWDEKGRELVRQDVPDLSGGQHMPFTLKHKDKYGWVDLQRNQYIFLDMNKGRAHFYELVWGRRGGSVDITEAGKVLITYEENGVLKVEHEYQF